VTQAEYNEQISVAVMLWRCWSILWLPISYLVKQIKMLWVRILV